MHLSQVPCSAGAGVGLFYVVRIDSGLVSSARLGSARSTRIEFDATSWDV